MHEKRLTVSWIRLGGILGISSMAVFTVAATAPLSDRATAALAACFGPLLSAGSYGLYRLLTIERKTVSAQIAAVANTIAGALVTAMLLIQLAVRAGGRAGVDNLLWLKLRRVDLGLDVAWDVYICLGTFLFGLSMLRHPRFGIIWGSVGMALSAALAALNLWTFPTPPAFAGLVDLGPLVGLWYAAVSVRVLWSVRWAERQLSTVIAVAA